ncbi:MAG: peptidase E [bacterium]|nr:peptidase E [bacterium]
MRKIVAIGGGEIGRPGFPIETLPIDKKIVGLSGKKSPRLLFLPTASSDSDGYIEVVKKYFGNKLGYKVGSLLLFNRSLLHEEIKTKILSSDIIYVGGGNTLKMMRRWRYLGVDKLLRKAYEKGIVMSGVSAGAVCWFNYAHSDSMSFYSPKKWSYIRVKCLNFVPFTLCPHYDGEKRDVHFKKMITKQGGIGIALDNCSAIEIIDDKYRILTSKATAKAYVVYKRRGKVTQKEIEKKEELVPLTQISKLCELKDPNFRLL